MLPAASFARTEKVCVPRLTLYDFGEVQADQEPLSSLHSNVEPDWDELNRKVAVLDQVELPGPLVIDVFGATVSTVQERVAGVASTLPAASFARTEKVWEPFARLEYAFGDVHAAHAPASSLHSNDDPASVALNPNEAEAELTEPVGPLVIEVPGADVSTVQVRVAGVASTLPRVSLARTENVCDPFDSPR